MASETRRACRRRGTSGGSVAAGVAMPTRPPSTNAENNVGRSGACRRRGTSGGSGVAGGAMPTRLPSTENDNVGRSGPICHRSPVGRRRGTSGGVATGGAMPTTEQQTRPPPTESTNRAMPTMLHSADNDNVGRSGPLHHHSSVGSRQGSSGSVATGSAIPTAYQQTGPPTNESKNSNVGNGSGRSSGVQRVSNDAVKVQHHSCRFERDNNCSCESCTLRSSGMAGITKWKDSEAKANIRDLLLGDKTHIYWNYPPARVYDDNKLLFHLYKFQNFSNNLRSLKRAILSEQEKSDFDEIAFARESNAFPRGPLTSQGNPYYDSSETKKILVKLAKDGSLEKYKDRPRDLKSSNPVFAEFNGKVFAKSVNREKRRVKESVGWQLKRNIQGSKKHNAKYDSKVHAASGGEKEGNNNT
jgi:hypothetical protein